MYVHEFFMKNRKEFFAKYRSEEAVGILHIFFSTLTQNLQAGTSNSCWPPETARILAIESSSSPSPDRSASMSVSSGSDTGFLDNAPAHC